MLAGFQSAWPFDSLFLLDVGNAPPLHHPGGDGSGFMLIAFMGFLFVVLGALAFIFRNR